MVNGFIIEESRLTTTRDLHAVLQCGRVVGHTVGDLTNQFEVRGYDRRGSVVVRVTACGGDADAVSVNIDRAIALLRAAKR